jgi:hypothetical protein
MKLVSVDLGCGYPSTGWTTIFISSFIWLYIRTSVCAFLSSVDICKSLNIFRPRWAWWQWTSLQRFGQLKIRTQALQTQTRNVSFLETNFTDQMYLTALWYSVTNSRLRSNSRFSFQGNIVRVNCIWQNMCNKFSTIFFEVLSKVKQSRYASTTERPSAKDREVFRRLMTRLEWTMYAGAELLYVCNSRRLSVHCPTPILPNGTS